MMVFAWASRFCFSQGTMMHSSKGLDWDWLSCILFKEICSRIWFERIDIRGRIKLIPDPIFLIPPLLFESNPWSSALSILLPCISLRCNQRALPCSCQRSIVPSLPCSCHRSSQLPPIRPMRRQQFCARMAPMMVPCSFASRLPVRLSLLNNFLSPNPSPINYLSMDRSILQAESGFQTSSPHYT